MITADLSRPVAPEGERDELPPSAALVLVVRRGEPVYHLVPLGRAPVTVGRGEHATLEVDDPAVSRAHFCLTIEGETLRLQDLGSKNGTFADGARARHLDAVSWPRVVRAGNSLMVLFRDARAHRRARLAAHLDGATEAGPDAEIDAGDTLRVVDERIDDPRAPLPPLWDRPEEVSVLVATALKRVAPQLTPAVELLERCLLRRWAGDARDLLSDVQRAARAAIAEGRVTVRGSDLAPAALYEQARSSARAPHSTDVIVETLRAQRGNVSRAARELGWHRTQLRRWLQRKNLRGMCRGRAGQPSSPPRE